jgi:hypothetical protein
MDLSPTNIARLEHVLRTLDFTQGADAEIRADGYLWICPKPGRKWKRSAKMRGQERAAAVVWLAQYRQRVASPPLAGP